MDKKLQSAFRDPLRILLRPIIKYCLKRSLGLHDLVESAKIVFVEAAEQEIASSEKRLTVSRISAVTGVHRKDAREILRQGGLPEPSMRFSHRVLGQWKSDRRFLTKSGNPRVLENEGEDSEFNRLVRLVSTDIHPGAVLFDLERVNAVERTKHGVKLNAAAYSSRSNPIENYVMLAEDTEDLMMGVLENTSCNKKVLPNYHAKALYDNISLEDVPKIRKWLFQQCSTFHQKAANYLAKYDLDINPKKGKKGGARIALGIFTKT